MTSTYNDVANGPPRRKQLSDQLDRLDGIIDLLAEGLPAAVADAAREGTRQAVKDAVLEILGNPDLRRLIVSTAVLPILPSASPPPSAPSIWARIKARLKAARAAVIGAVHPVVKEVVEYTSTATATVVNTVKTVTRLLPWKRIVMVSALIGVSLGAVSYLAPHEVGAVLSGVCGAVTSVAVQLGAWMRRYLRVLRFGFA